VRAACERYGIPYNTGPLPKQFGSVVRKIVRLALPDRLRGSAGEEPRPVPEPAPERKALAAAQV
jgi:hypothetical protein